MRPMLHLFSSTLCAALLIGAANQAQAQKHAKNPGPSYPTKPIRLIVPFAPGGGNDTLTRAVGQKLTERLSQQVVVDNRAGAGGVIGAEIVAKATADGHTLLMGSSSFAVNPSLIAKLPYDVLKDFAPVALVGAASYLLVVHPSVPVNSVAELVAFAKAKPGRLNYASAGSGSPLHLGAELFKAMTGTNLTHIPYKGGFPAVSAVLSAEAQVVFGSITASMPLVKASRLRPLAVTSVQRSALFPELPTVAESGVPGYESTNWYGVLAPAGTPKPVVTKLNAELTTIMQMPDLRERMLSNQGIEPLSSTPEQFAVYIRNEVAKWAKVTKAIGMRAE